MGSAWLVARDATQNFAPDATPPLLILRHALLWRLGLAVLLVVGALGWSEWRAWREQLRSDLPATAALVSQLLNDDLVLHASPFSRMVAAIDLGPTRHLGRRAPFCAEVLDLAGRRLTYGCQPELDPAPGATDRLALQLAREAAAGLSVTHTLVLPAGIKAGVILVEPHWLLEGRALGQRALMLLAAGGALLVVLVMASRLVARALAPANQVLLALRRLAEGDLAVRLPPMALAELHHIGEAFNQVAGSMAAIERQQQQLAAHQLQAREAERRRLARELHDELGQSLTALQADAAAMRLMTADLPQAAGCARAMGETTAQLLEGLQRVLADLRPQALDEFGLPVALRTLARSPQRRSDGGELQVRLHLPEHWEALPPDHDIHIYRLVQEALTNARRHSQAARVQITLAREDDCIDLRISDDGRHESHAALSPGHGLQGMQERVQALGGQARWFDVPGGGLGLHARWPLQREAA